MTDIPNSLSAFIWMREVSDEYESVIMATKQLNATGTGTISPLDPLKTRQMPSSHRSCRMSIWGQLNDHLDARETPVSDP